MTNSPEVTVRITEENDIVEVRKAIRDSIVKTGFGITDVTRIVTAASELARNIYRYAGSGYMELYQLNSDGVTGVELAFIDHGPGIEDVKKAMEQGYTTGGGLGMGLPGAKRLMDEMEIHSEQGKGTTVKIKKLLKR